MNRVYFVPADEEREAGGASRPRPSLAVLVEMAGGQAAATWNRKRLGEPVKRAEMLRGFERALPDGSALRVQAFPIPRPEIEEPKPEPKAEPEKPRTQLELLQAVEAGTIGTPGVAKPSALDSLPLFTPGGFEPYRVRAWLDGRELREVVGQAGREDARLALILLLVVGIGEVIWSARLYPLVGFTRLILTGPVFLLGAVGVWKRWRPSVSLALVVAIADTIIFMVRTVGKGSAEAFLLIVLARALLILALWRLRKSGW